MTIRFRADAAGWAAFYAAVLGAWGMLWVMVQDRAAFSGAWGLELLAGLCRAGAGDAGFGGLYAMWAVMAVAMMAPTAVPAFRTWGRLPAAASGGAAGTAALVAGYLAVWLGASGGFAAVQAAMAAQGWLAPDGASLSPWLNAVLCAVAGGYQFSQLKGACLTKCRMPLTFFLERWRPGLAGAFRSGLDLGIVCLGCCWALMALAFVGGMASLVWMGLATALMVVEKLPDIGRHVTRPLGWALLAAALAFAVHGALA
jgi:predicted metal-binding membrane protein